MQKWLLYRQAVCSACIYGSSSHSESSTVVRPLAIAEIYSWAFEITNEATEKFLVYECEATSLASDQSWVIHATLTCTENPAQTQRGEK